MSNRIKVTIRDANILHPLRLSISGDSAASTRENVKVVLRNYVESSSHTPCLDETPLFPQAIMHIFRSHGSSSCPELTKCRGHDLGVNSTHGRYLGERSCLLMIQVMALNPESSNVLSFHS